MVWMVVPLRLSLTRWRLLLLAAFVLLAGAMGGGDAVARVGVGQTATGCPDQGGCDQRLTAPAQPALVQAALRIDGKATASGDGGFATLPGRSGLPAFQWSAKAHTTGRDVAHRGHETDGPGQPRGPPTGA